MRNLGTNAQQESHVEMEGETGDMFLQVEQCKEPLEAVGS